MHQRRFSERAVHIHRLFLEALCSDDASGAPPRSLAGTLADDGILSAFSRLFLLCIPEMAAQAFPAT